jgi:opacity protein-like surface antigen
MKNKTISMLALAGVLAVSVSTANANNFNYNYVELEVADAIDDADPTLTLAGSYDVSSNVNLIADYSRTTLDSSGSTDLDFVKYSVGVGYHSPINSSTDMTANVKYIGTEIEVTNGFRSASLGDGSGFGIGLGLRHKVSDNFEANAAVDYMDVEDGTDTAFSAGGRYYFNQAVSAGIGYTTGDFDGIDGSLRYNFL